VYAKIIIRNKYTYLSMSSSLKEINDVDEVQEGDELINETSVEGVDIIPNSLCVSCGYSGITRLLIHKIPFFRELILASFSCDECGYSNNEVTFGGEIQPQGSIFRLTVSNAQDLDRQIIKADSASIKIPEIDFEIPPNTQKGEFFT
jgi:zinc finger protein